MSRQGNLATFFISFTVLSIIWVYLFSIMDIGYSDVFDFMAFHKLLNITTIFYLIVMGFVIGAAFFVILHFKEKLKGSEVAILSAVGSFVTIIVGWQWFTAIGFFVFMMLFYAFGCMFISYREIEFGRSGWSKFKHGWTQSRRAFTFLGAGALFGGIIFTYASLPYYQGLVKSSALNFTSSINFRSFLTRDDVKDLVISQELTKNEIREIVVNEYETYDWFNELPSAQKELLIENATEQTYQKQLADREKNIDRTYNFLQTRNISTSNLTADLIDKIPFTKAMLDLLPFFAGFIMLSFVVLYGQIFVAPFAALLSLGIEKKE